MPSSNTQSFLGPARLLTIGALIAEYESTRHDKTPSGASQLAEEGPVDRLLAGAYLRSSIDILRMPRETRSMLTESTTERAIKVFLEENDVDQMSSVKTTCVAAVRRQRQSHRLSDPEEGAMNG